MACRIDVVNKLTKEVEDHFEPYGTHNVNPDIVQPLVDNVNIKFSAKVAEVRSQRGNDDYFIEIDFPTSLVDKYYDATVKKETQEAAMRAHKDSSVFGIDPVTGESTGNPDEMLQYGDADPGLFFDLGTKQNKESHAALDAYLTEFLQRHGVKIQTIEEYSKEHPDRLAGQEVYAFIDLLHNIVGWANHKGSESLLEETMHLIVHKLWNDPRIQNIRNARTPEGKRWMELSQEWLDYYSAYAEAYEGRDNTEELIEKEIVTKIITNFNFKYWKKGSYVKMNKYEKMINRFLNWLTRVFTKTINSVFKNNQEKETKREIIEVDIPAIVKNVLGDLANEFYNTKMTIDMSSTTDIVRTIALENPKSNTATFITRALNTLKSRRNQFKEEFGRVYDRVMKSRQKYLDTLFSAEQRALLYDLGLDLMTIKQNNTLTEAQEEILEEYRELILAERKDMVLLRAMDKLNRQISAINRAIDSHQYDRAVEIFINGFDFSKVTGEDERIPSIVDRLNTINKMLQDPSKVSLQDFMHATNFMRTYQPVIEELATLIKKDFKSLSNSQSGKLLKDIKEARERFTNVEGVLTRVWREKVLADILTDIYTDENGDILDPGLSIESMMNDVQFDRRNWEISMGFLRNARQWQLQAFIKKYSTLKNKIHRDVQEDGIDLVSNVMDLVSELKENTVVKRYLRKYNIKNPEELFLEFDSDGKLTGNILNKYDLGKWEAARQKAAINIIEKTENYIRNKYGVTVNIPRGNSQKDKMERQRFLSETSYSLDNETQANEEKSPIAKFYGTQWAKWYSANTMPNPLLEQIIAQRKAELTPSEYKEWLTFNWYEYTDKHTGEVLRVPRGELSVPSDGSTILRAGKFKNNTNNYVNNSFDQLMAVPEFESMYNHMLSLKHATDDKIPMFMSGSYHFRYQAPQISKTLGDQIYQHSNIIRSIKNKVNRTELWADIKDTLAGTIRRRVDDEYYMRDVNAVESHLPPSYTPPLRFTTKLDTPTLMSRDILKSLIVYSEMGETYDKFTKEMDFFNSLTEAIKREKFDQKKPFWNSVARHNVDGKESNTLKNIEEAFKLFIYDEGIKEQTISVLGQEVSITKLSQSITTWLRDKNLKMNFPAITAGFVMAYGKESFVERMLGRTTTTESNRWARKKLLSNLHQIVLVDTESPIKTNKISALMMKTNLLRSNADYFRNLNKEKVARILGTTYDYGMWKMADFLPKVQGMLSIMDNYRYINGKWHTRETWIKDGGTKENWKTHKENSFYNLVNYDGKKVTSDIVTDREWDFVTNRSIALAADLDTQPSDLDKFAAKQYWWGQFVFLHRGWMILGFEKRAKLRHYNLITNKWEEGSYVSTIRFMKNFIQNYGASRIFNSHIRLSAFNDLRPEEKEGVMRTVWELAVANLTLVMAFLINMIASGDDDEEKVFLQYLAYSATRTYLEQMAFFSPREFKDLIGRPVAGVDFYEQLSNTISMLGSPEGKKEVRSGPYKGKTKLHANLIKLTPNLRGYYETVPFDLPGSSSGKGLQGKNSYIKNRVLGNGGVIDGLFTLPGSVATGILVDDKFRGHLKDAK